jgi:UDP-hydrolysing UDP-N-acetyl-D-glucosamine 2-epimerase
LDITAAITKRVIGVVTVARSDSGHCASVLRAIQRSDRLDLRVLVTGMHLSAEFGSTWRDVEALGVGIHERIETTMSSDTPTGVAKSIGLGVIGFADVFARWRPDVLMVVGDRFEMLAAAVAAMPYVIPIAHVHGGETTEGAFDEAIRHSLTKLSHLHFVAAPEFGRRITQLGEEPWRITVTGAPGIDSIREATPWSKRTLEEKLALSLDKATLLVTLHPVTLDYESTTAHITELFAALEDAGVQVVFTYPNADTRGREVIAEIERFVARRSDFRVFPSLGPGAYYGLLQHAAAMVGNSSSGLTEAPHFELPVVNIGDRQKGRLRGVNVLDVAGDRRAIGDGIRRALSAEFRDSLRGMTNPYGDGHAAERIVRVLETVDLDRRLTMKTFHDLP